MSKYVISAVFILGILIFLWKRDKQPVVASADLLVHASIDKVWNVQSNISQWQKWNGDIESMKVDGEIGLGTIFIWKSGGITIKSKITEFSPQHKIAWEGKTFGINAYHVWQFTEVDNNVHVFTEEKFVGPLAWLLPGTMRKQIATALNHGVLVLKQEAEKDHENP